jgi:hypothetical protein
MSENENTVSLATYVSPELLSRVQRAARQSNRSLAGQVRDLLEREYNTTQKIETR